MRTVQIMSIDLAKNFIQVLALDEANKEVFNRRIVISTLLELVRKHKPKRVAVEACATAHYWARQFHLLGVEVILIPPQVVAPFRMGDKNDANDCWAIFEASLRPKLNPVPVKTEEHQVLQTWIRRREALIGERTQRVNAIRAYLAEFGIYVPKGISKFYDQGRKLAEKETWGVDHRVKEVFEKDMQGLSELDEQIAFFDYKVEKFAKENEKCGKLQELAGIGPITAVALVASLIKPKNFKNGRQFAAYLGLVPRQNSTGGITRLYGIGKDGNRYLRQLLIHGGRSVLRVAPDNEDALSRWALKKKEQRGFNRACVAVANKNTRMVWAVMAQLAA
jgi:transposase